MKQSIIRRKSKQVRVGSLKIGGDAPISVQSMTNTDPADQEATLAQVQKLEAAGCELVRLTVPRPEDARIFSYLKERDVRIPLAADIHFDYRAAVESAAAGADKIRVNPGNIGETERVRAVVQACRRAGIPIRIGVNSGSLEKHILERYGAPTAEALAESALYSASLLERYDFTDTIMAVKSSDPAVMIRATRILAEKTDYPLHLGVTEAGSLRRGIVKSAAGIGALLCDGIGDTIRVSLTAPPEREVEEGKNLLAALGLLSQPTVNVVSCPTCGRTKVNLIALVEEFERRAALELHPTCDLTVAIMGCVVNGPGEAREADLGVACGLGDGLLFAHGLPLRKVKAEHIVDALLDGCREKMKAAQIAVNRENQSERQLPSS